MASSITLLLLLLSPQFISPCTSSSSYTESSHSSHSSQTDDSASVIISRDCAAVLLFSGTAVGGIAGSLIFPALLGVLGSNTGAHSTAGSFAAKWRSTLPRLAKSTLFETLKNAALGGPDAEVLLTKPMLRTAAIDGVISTSVVQQLCTAIDTAAPNTNARLMIDSIVTGVVSAGGALEKVQSSIPPELKAAAKAAILQAAGVFNRVSGKFSRRVTELAHGATKAVGKMSGQANEWIKSFATSQPSNEGKAAKQAKDSELEALRKEREEMLRRLKKLEEAVHATKEAAQNFDREL